MSLSEPMSRVVTDPSRCGGRPCIRGTRIDISIIHDALAEGFDAAEIIKEYWVLQPDDIRASLAYAAELAREFTWKLPTGS